MENYHYGYKAVSSQELSYNNCDSIAKIKIKGKPDKYVRTDNYTNYKTTEEIEILEINKINDNSPVSKAYSCGVFSKFRETYEINTNIKNNKF